MLATVAFIWVVAPSSAMAERITGKPELRAVAGYYGYAAAVGKGGVVYVMDRRTRVWKREPVAIKTTLRQVELVSRRDLWSLAEDGQVVRLTGGRWSVVPGVEKGAYRGLALAGSYRGAVVGRAGAVFHLVSGRWERYYASPVKTDLLAVARVGRGGGERFIAVGKGGAAIALGGVGASVSGDNETTGLTSDLVTIAACQSWRAEAVAAGAQVALRSTAGDWRVLPAPPAALTGVTVGCRGGRVKRIYGVSGAAILWHQVGDKSWHRFAVSDVDTLRGLAWLDSRRLIAVGDVGGFGIVAIKELVKAAALAKAGPLPPFPAYPGAKRFCEGRVYPQGGRGHISWSWYATPASRRQVSRFFVAKLGKTYATQTRDADTWRYPKTRPTRVLVIRAAAGFKTRPDCKLPAGTKTVIEVSFFPR